MPRLRKCLLAVTSWISMQNICALIFRMKLMKKKIRRKFIDPQICSITTALVLDRNCHHRWWDLIINIWINYPFIMSKHPQLEKNPPKPSNWKWKMMMVKVCVCVLSALRASEFPSTHFPYHISPQSLQITLSQLHIDGCDDFPFDCTNLNDWWPKCCIFAGVFLTLSLANVFGSPSKQTQNILSHGDSFLFESSQ